MYQITSMMRAANIDVTDALCSYDDDIDNDVVAICLVNVHAYIVVVDLCSFFCEGGSINDINIIIIIIIVVIIIIIILVVIIIIIINKLSCS